MNKGKKRKTGSSAASDAAADAIITGEAQTGQDGAGEGDSKARPETKPEAKTKPAANAKTSPMMLPMILIPTGLAIAALVVGAYAITAQRNSMERIAAAENLIAANDTDKITAEHIQGIESRIMAEIETLRRQIAALPTAAPETAPVDTAPLEARLTAIETRLDELIAASTIADEDATTQQTESPEDTSGSVSWWGFLGDAVKVTPIDGGNNGNNGEAN